MTEPRTWRFGLTADEWLHLAAEGPDSEVASCCGDIGQLQEWLNAVATSQGEGQASLLYPCLFEAYDVALASHEVLADQGSFPLLHRVLEGAHAEQDAWEAKTAEYRARQAELRAQHG